MDCLGLYMMSNQIILCVDVFGSIMESRILSQLDCRSITPGRNAARSYGSALIPLIGITPDSILFMANAYIYILHVTVVFHLSPSLFGFLCNCSANYLFIYNI